MRLLAVETSTLAGGAAVLDGESVVGEYMLDIRLTHSERLMGAVDRLLADAGWAPRDLDALAVAVGPGSFTGLRIGISAVKGLAFALGIPVAAVPTLDALASTLPFAALPVLPVLDARKGEVYTALYRWDEDKMRREWDYLALAPDALAGRLTEPVIVTGNGADAVHSPWVRRPPVGRRSTSAACVAALGRELIARGEVVDAAGLVPLYLRPSEAELRRRGVAVH